LNGIRNDRNGTVEEWIEEPHECRADFAPPRQDNSCVYEAVDDKSKTFQARGESESGSGTPSCWYRCVVKGDGDIVPALAYRQTSEVACGGHEELEVSMIDEATHPFDQAARPEVRQDPSVVLKVHREERRDPGLQRQVLSLERKVQSLDLLQR
jgi:hypothetical protein